MLKSKQEYGILAAALIFSLMLAGTFTWVMSQKNASNPILIIEAR